MITMDEIGEDSTITVYRSSGFEFSFGMLIIVILFGSLWVYMITKGVM